MQRFEDCMLCRSRRPLLGLWSLGIVLSSTWQYRLRALWHKTKHLLWRAPLLAMPDGVCDYPFGKYGLRSGSKSRTSLLSRSGVSDVE